IEPGEWAVQRGREVDSLSRGCEPERAEGAGMWWYDHPSHTQCLRQRATEQRARAAERQERQPPRIDTARDADPFQRPRHSHPGDASTAGTYRLDQDGGQSDRYPADVRGGLRGRLPTDDDTRVGARSAHVEGEQVGPPRRLTHEPSSHDAARGPREGQARRTA